MPLVRYEIRNEHSLANPQLYRTAAKDDPEGLLEGVAMAGLVGIVRQLGDLAEFAAEVFRDLHEEVMATASRGHELLARVQQLEAEMPAVEKALLSETNQLRFAYTPGAEWHASIRNDQNHCTQGDLPRFIRNSYEECRGPPRLFLLDKFDVAGAGACLKRYTDPSFFRTEWASSELMKAERVQRDKKARREKKKGRRRRNGDGKESILVDQLPPRFSKEPAQPDQPRMRNLPHAQRSAETTSPLENMNPNQSINSVPNQSAQAQGVGQDVRSTITGTTGDPGYNLDTLIKSSEKLPPASAKPEIPASSHPEQAKDASAMDMEEVGISKKLVEAEDSAAYPGALGSQLQQEDVVGVADDGASESEHFLDALTTMESEVDSDSDSRLRQDKDGAAERMLDVDEGQSTLRQDLGLSGTTQTSMDEKVILPEQSQSRILLDSLHQDAAQHSSASTAGLDAIRTPTSTTSVHVRRHSIDTISSSSTRKAQHNAKPREKFLTLPKLLIPGRDEKAAPKSVEPGAVASFSAGVKVSKMVAAFERGSLDQIHDEEPENKSNAISKTSIPSESLPASTSQASLEVGTPDVPQKHKFNSIPSQDFPSPLPASPAKGASTESSSPQLHGFPSPLRDKVEDSSFHSRRLSQGSLDSPPDSPIFSALHSPMSPVKSPWISQSSPNSRRLGFSRELIGPDSPTSVPVLAVSPTSQTNSPDLSPELEGMQPSQGGNSPEEETSTVTSPSTSSVELPLPLPTAELPEIASPSSTAQSMSRSRNSSLASPSEDSENLALPASARTPDDFSDSISIRMSPDFSSPVVEGPGSPQELTNLVAVHDVLRSPTVERKQSTSPRPQNTEYSEGTLQPSESLDDNAMNSGVSDTTSAHSPSVDRLSTVFSPVLSPSVPPSSTSLSEVSPKHIANDKPEQPPSFPSMKKSNEDSPGCELEELHDLHVLPVSTTAHNRHPSQTLETTQHLALASSSKSSQDPSASEVPSKAFVDNLVASPKLTNDVLPPSVPSQTLDDLPPPTPPSKSQRDFLPPPPPPSRTLHELPAPPPPSRSPPPLSAAKPALIVDVQDKLLEAITAHDKSTLKKVKTMQNPSLRNGNDRSHLLEQIRAQSFNLRQTAVQKLDPPPPRPVTNINVAAILEKANAIRQAFAGSDEEEDDDDDWSDL